MGAIDKKAMDNGRLNQFPWFRVTITPQTRNSYCDNSRSKSFDTENEAIEFAKSQKGLFRIVERINGQANAGYGYKKWLYTVIAKWGIKKVNGKKVIGRIK